METHSGHINASHSADQMSGALETLPHRRLPGKIAGLAFAFAASISLIAFNQAAAEEKVIAVSFPNYSKQGSVITTLDEATKKGTELGYKVVLDDPGTDLNRQVNTINTWIQQKVPVIIAVTLEPKVFEGIAKKAREAGVKWITYAGKLENQDATVGFQRNTRTVTHWAFMPANG